MPLTNQEKELFALAREQISTGRFPRMLPASVWAGPGSRDTCSLCRQTIEPAHMEYELAGYGGETFHFHVRCHAIWQLAANDRISGS